VCVRGGRRRGDRNLAADPNRAHGCKRARKFFGRPESPLGILLLSLARAVGISRTALVSCYLGSLSRGDGRYAEALFWFNWRLPAAFSLGGSRLSLLTSRPSYFSLLVFNISKRTAD
jgi:hypothetical protein